MTQIARADGLQGKFKAAHLTLDEVEKALRVDNKFQKPRIRYMLERGRVLNSSGNVAQSRQLFLNAWNLAMKSHEDFFAVDAAHMLAIVEPTDNQQEWNFKALDLAEKSDDPKVRKWAASIFNNIGWTYFDMKRYSKALDAFQTALQRRIDDGGSPNEIHIAKWSVAKALRVLNHINEALQIQRELLTEYEEAGERDGYVYEELGECLLAFGQNSEARRYFGLAYEELSKDESLIKNEPQRLHRLRQLAQEKSPSDFSYSSYS